MPFQKINDLECLECEEPSIFNEINNSCLKRNVSYIPQLTPECPRLEFGPSKSEAKKIKLVTVGVHGDEQAPLIALNEMFKMGFLSNYWRDCPFSSVVDSRDERIIFLLGNPKATSLNKRFVDVNLNRLFKPPLMAMETGDLFYKENYEMSRLHEIAQAIQECDEFLDLHSTSSPSPPFVIPGECSQSRTLAKSFPVDFVIEDLYQVIKGTTIDYANSLGKICSCIECGLHTSRETVERAKTFIHQFILGNRTPKAHEILSCKSSQSLCKGFKFIKPIQAFQRVDFEELIAVDEVGEIRCPFKDGYIIMPSSNHVVGEEAWFWGVPK